MIPVIINNHNRPFIRKIKNHLQFFPALLNLGVNHVRMFDEVLCLFSGYRL